MFSLSFVGGSKSAEEGPNPLVYLDRGGSISASGFGLGGPYALAILDRGSKSGGVQILWDTGIFKTPKDIDECNTRCLVS